MSRGLKQIILVLFFFFVKKSLVGLCIAVF